VHSERRRYLAREVEVELMDYIIERLYCPFCISTMWAILLSGKYRNIDLVWFDSGDPRVKLLRKHLGSLEEEDLPTGVIKGHLVNASRGFIFDYHFFKRLYSGD